MKTILLISLALLTLQLPAQELPALTDSIVTTISSRYQSKSFFHRLMMGRNYRDIWSTPVKLPVLHFNSFGFTIEKLGGGQQTKTLHLLDRNGGHWVLRTVDKDVEGAVPPIFHNNLGEAVVQDMISASLPYSHVIVGKLAKSAGIEAPMPRMVFVADNEGLKEHRSLFANKVCTIEATMPDENTLDTEEAVSKLAADNKNMVLQKRILKARLLDMLVGDWDRHEDQWMWVSKDSGGSAYYYVIPKDRDNALFSAEGLFPAFMKFSFMPHIKGFKDESNNLKQLNRKSIIFDEFFLNELDAEEWNISIIEFQQQLNDSVIEESLRTLPQNIYVQYGHALGEKLRMRRDGLLDNGMKYYRHLSSVVDVVGSDKEELFVASGRGNQLLVTVYRIEKNQRKKIYERSFDGSDTKSVILNGLKGADQFIVENTVPPDIKLKIFGNEGKDVYSVRGKTKIRIIDEEDEKNIVKNNSTSRISFR